MQGAYLGLELPQAHVMLLCRLCQHPELQHPCLQLFMAILSAARDCRDGCVKHLCQAGLLACSEYHHIVTELLPVSWLP